MKRLLLITYAFPPRPSPGSLRPGYLARYLPEFGWDVTVLTPSWGEPPFRARIVPTASKPRQLNAAAPADSVLPQGSRLRRVLGTIKSTLLFPDDLSLWIPPAIRTGQRLMRAERFDAILSTALPTCAHVIGSFLSKRFSTPWIADYRDAWSGNPYMPWGPVKRSLEVFAERAAIAQASDVTTISEHIASHLSELHRREVRVIPNAYDPGDWDAIPDTPPAAFDFVYTGTMYDGKRSPDLLFEALAALKRDGHPAARAHVHFYGAAGVEVEESARKFGIGSQVTLHGVVPRPEAMRAQRASAALLLFLSMNPATSNETGSKYLEYLGARRATIVFGPADSVMRNTVARNRLGWFASNVEDAIDAVKSAYERYANGEYDFTPDASALFSARDLASAFASRLDAACETASAAKLTTRVSRTPNDGIA
jgi:Glycosyl transferase 4-like domain/Glycosyl transferases group 1